MTLGLYDQRARRRRRFRWAVVKWLFALFAILAAGAFAYESGSTLARQDVISLKDQISGLSATVARLENEKEDLDKALVAAKQGQAAAEKRYQEDVPTGALAKILGLAKDRLDSGVEPERIAFLVGAAENVRECDNAPVEKRFIVDTELQINNTNNWIRFADGTITVTGQGQPAINAQGQREAWFDPTQPVTLRFKDIGGKVTEASGALPLNTSLVKGDREYRFNAFPGARGFVRVTSDSCRFP